MKRNKEREMFLRNKEENFSFEASVSRKSTLDIHNIILYAA